MKKVIAVLMCLISFQCLASTVDDPDPKNGIEAVKIIKDYKDGVIGEAGYIEALSACSKHNSYCSMLLGEFYYDKEEYSLAYPLLSKYSDEFGRDIVEYQLGYMFSNGFSVLQNSDKAMMHFKKSAELGSSDAAFNIGLIYEKKTRLFNNSHYQNSSNMTKNITENAIPAYAWLKVSQVLGHKTYLFEGKEIGISVRLDKTRELLSAFSKLQEADKLASQICSTIPKCTQ